MTPTEALLAFSFAAGLLTLTPGLDTALVLRTAAVEGARPAMAAGLGIALGCLGWGLLAALGLGAVLAVSELAYTAVKLAGAAYLVWLGIGMLRAGLRRQSAAPQPSESGSAPEAADGTRRWLVRGLMTNLLNPKVGVFYVSFLPQFVPVGVDVVGFSVLLAAVHAAMGIAWFGALTLATRPLTALLRRPAVTRGLDIVTGSVMVAFGLRLALDRRIG